MHRIAILFEYPTLNGGERSMLQVLERVDRTEFDIVAIAPAEGRLADELSRLSCEHMELELRDECGQRLPRTEVCERLSGTIKHVSPALVHANSLAMGRLTGAIADYGTHSLTHLRDIIGLSRAAVAELNRNRLLIAVSEATRRFHVGQGVDPERTRVIRNGVDCKRLQPRPSTGRLRRELQVPEASFIVLTIGQIGLRKGQDVLAEAAAGIVSQVPQAHFVVIGERNSAKAESVEFEQQFRSRFQRAGLEGRLHCLGYRDDVERLLNEADLLVHPAKQEPLGRVLLEAAASGLPIVATDVGGTSEIITDGVSGRLVAASSPDELTAAVIELAMDKEKRGRFATAARRRMLAEFSADSAAARLCGAWREFLE